MSRMIVGFVCFLGALPAASTRGEIPFDPAAAAATIAPYLDEQTVAVAHVDLRRIDISAIRKALGNNDKAAKDGPSELLPERVDHWLKKFQNAGGSDLFVVVSLADVPERPPCII